MQQQQEKKKKKSVVAEPMPVPPSLVVVHRRNLFSFGARGVAAFLAVAAVAAVLVSATVNRYYFPQCEYDTEVFGMSSEERAAVERHHPFGPNHPRDTLIVCHFDVDLYESLFVRTLEGQSAALASENKLAKNTERCSVVAAAAPSPVLLPIRSNGFFPDPKYGGGKASSSFRCLKRISAVAYQARMVRVSFLEYVASYFV